MESVLLNDSVRSFPVFFEKVEEVGTDERFMKVKIFLMHLGENYNKSFFSKEVVEEAIPSLAYIPIVGFIKYDSKEKENDFTNHKYIIVENENGKERKYAGCAYGVILSSTENNAHFEIKMCDDGIEREFLVVDGIMWSMFQDSADIMKRDIIKNHSMEIFTKSIEGYFDENEIFVYTKFSFKASCILGDKTSSAMINSTVELSEFSINDFVEDIQKEIYAKYTAFSKINGGNNMPININTDFTQTVMEQIEDISNQVASAEIFRDKWGDNVPRYFFKDIQDNEVIVIDRKSNHQLYGFPFVIEGDKVIINFACGSRKKTKYENFEESDTANENNFDFSKYIDEIETKCFEKIDELKTKVDTFEQLKEEKEKLESDFSVLKDEYEEIKTKYEDYERAEQEKIKAQMEELKTSHFERFETVLGSNPEFEELKKNRDALSAEEIENKCSVLFARTNLSTDFSKKNKENSAVGIIEDDYLTDGFIATKYGNIPVKK